MDWDSELMSAQKAPPRKGRRAGLSLLSSRDEDKSSFEEALDNSTSESNASTSWQANQQPMPPPRGRRANWANEDIKSSKKRSVSSSISGLLDRQRLQSPDQLKSGFDSEDDIPVIPDLDDVVDEYKPVVTYTSSIAMNRVATYKELDSAGPSYLKLDGIDLSILSKCLLDTDDVQTVDEDKVLTWDNLFTEVASHLRSDSDCNSQNSTTDN